jgi:adenylylsulfate kinase
MRAPRPQGPLQEGACRRNPGIHRISAPYEAPEKPELTINTTKETPDQSVAQLLAYLDGKGYLSA